MDSITLLTNTELPYFPIALHTLDYENKNKVIQKKEKERTSDYIVRLAKTRSDKRFCCTGTSCSFQLNISDKEEDNPYQKTVLPRTIEGGSIKLDIEEENNTPILTYENQKYILRSIQLFQDTLFTWNQNQDVDQKIRNEYLHDGELHLHFEIYNPGKPANLTIVIGLKNDDRGRTLLAGSLSQEPNSTTMRMEEVMPSNMSFFTYTMNNNSHRVIIMEDFVQMSNFEDVVRIIQTQGSVLPSNIKQPLVRPLDIENKAMYGFLKVNAEKRKGNYSDKVYYQKEIRIRYNPNITESNRIQSAQERILFTMKIPPNFKLVRKDDIGPLQSFLHPVVFNGIYLSIMILCAGVIYLQGIHFHNFSTMLTFFLAFWTVVFIGFIITITGARRYYHRQKSALPSNDPQYEQKTEELNKKLDNIANPGSFIGIGFGVLGLGGIVFALIYFLTIRQTN